MKHIQIVPGMSHQEMSNFYELLDYTNEEITTASGLDPALVTTFFGDLRAGLLDEEHPLLLSATAGQEVRRHLANGQPEEAVFSIRVETHVNQPAAMRLVREVSLAEDRSAMTTSSMPEPDPVRRLAYALRLAHEEAGSPSYRRLERSLSAVIGNVAGCSAAAICRALGGDRVPSWDMVEGLLHLFGVPDEEVRTAWHKMWIEARRAQNGHPIVKKTALGETTERTTVARPEGYVCSICGSWVVDASLHDSWHQSMQRQSTPSPQPVSAKLLDAI